MGWSPYVVGGIASGVGQGVNNMVGTIVARRKEEEAKRHQLEQEAIQNRRLDQADQREKDAYDRGIFGQDMQFAEKGGLIEDDPTDNGTGSIGMHVGISTATTQPSEHQGIQYQTVGTFKGKRYSLPADGLTPAERLKERGRQRRLQSAGTAFPNLHLTPGQRAALEDPEMGDDTWKELQKENFELDPANVRNKARIAGATAEARFPWMRGAGGAEVGPDGLTPLQRRTQNRADRNQFISSARGQEAQYGNIANAPLPKKSDFGYDSGMWGNANKAGVSQDSLDYEQAMKDVTTGRVRSRMNAGMAGYAADSAARAGQVEAAGGDVNSPAMTQAEAVAKIKHAHAVYQEAMAEARTPEAKKEATDLYLKIERETLAAAGRRPTVRR